MQKAKSEYCEKNKRFKCFYALPSCLDFDRDFFLFVNDLEAFQMKERKK